MREESLSFVLFTILFLVRKSLECEISSFLEILSEKAMAPHSSTLAWRIPGTEKPSGLLSMGSHRVGHDWSDLAVAAAEIL